MRDPAALDVEGTIGRAAGIDTVTFQDDHLMARPGEREGSCEPRDAATRDHKPHAVGLSSVGARSP
jgi:hypothetical protein